MAIRHSGRTGVMDPCQSAADEDERRLLRRAAAWPCYPDWAALTEEAARAAARQDGLDFATALLYDRLVRSPEHGPFIEEVAGPGRRNGTPIGERATIAVVPGAFYLEDRTSGADGRFIRESAARLGCRDECVPLESFGALATNARILLDWLLARSRPEPIVLVSLSKASAEVKLALASSEATLAFRNVTAWISLSGLYHGTPLVTWLRRRPWRLAFIRLLFRWRGYHYAALAELERGPRRALDFELRPPSHLRIVHVVGFPLRRHLSCPLARRGHRRIGPLGPNDGGAILLADLQRLPGVIFPVWGADHYLRPAQGIQSLMSRLLDYVSRPASRPDSRDICAVGSARRCL
jgi:hypothetical protein